MPKFRVTITRTTSESGSMEIEAATPEAAEAAAWVQYNGASMEEHAEFYEPDDYAESPYVSDMEELE